jgi:hypothetical protein
VVIEHLVLDGDGHNLNGIVNQYTQELSYVNDVSMTGLGGVFHVDASRDPM